MPAIPKKRFAFSSAAPGHPKPRRPPAPRRAGRKAKPGLDSTRSLDANLREPARCSTGIISRIENNHGPDSTTRKPMVLTAVEGPELLRLAVRQSAPMLLNVPPRNTRAEPVAEPCGLAMLFVE